MFFLAVVLVAFGLASPRFLTAENFGSIAFQLPELGLLTLAMLVPIISGGLNLASTYTANMAGLTLAWVLQMNGGPQAGPGAFVVGSLAAIAVGTLAGLVMGLVIAYVGAHPILVSLAMMIFLRGLGEFLTRGVATCRASPPSSSRSATARCSASRSRCWCSWRRRWCGT